MFSRAQLFSVRDALVETFHSAQDSATRLRAFDRIVKINARLLRGHNPFPPGWFMRAAPVADATQYAVKAGDIDLEGVSMREVFRDGVPTERGAS
jgi:hypothetical protein